MTESGAPHAEPGEVQCWVHFRWVFGVPWCALWFAFWAKGRFRAHRLAALGNAVLVKAVPRNNNNNNYNDDALGQC